MCNFFFFNELFFVDDDIDDDNPFFISFVCFFFVYFLHIIFYRVSEGSDGFFVFQLEYEKCDSLCECKYL